MDTYGGSRGRQVSMCKYVETVVLQRPRRAMQVHGGLGYSRAHSVRAIPPTTGRYRITAGTQEEIRCGGRRLLFGFMKQKATKGVNV